MNMRLSSDELNDIIYERKLPDGFAGDKAVEENQFGFEHRLGSIQVRERWFEGVHLSYGNWQLNKNVSVRAESDTPVIEMHFSLSGHSVAHIHPSNQCFNIANNQHNIYFMPDFEGTFSVENSAAISRFFEVHFSESYFKRFADGGNAAIERFQNAVNKRQIATMGTQNRIITPAMHQLVNELIAPAHQGILQRLFIESKVLELLMLQITQFDQEIQPAQEAPLSRQDLEKIHHARYLLEQNMSNPCSLLTLARTVGLNDFKLKKGFKQVFNYTIFGYLHELRMQQARRMLLDQQELWMVASHCGYQHVSHFSTAFRKKFGISPGQFRAGTGSYNHVQDGIHFPF